jgi:parallel beta-helix repeat protein
MGSIPYVQAAAELRGRVNGTLNATTYRVTCDLVVAPGEELIIPAGARLEATGLYSIEVHGTLRVQGTAGNRCVFCPCQTPVSGDVWGGIEFINREFAPSVLEYVDIVGYEEINVHKAGVTFRNVRFDDGYMHGVNVSTTSLTLSDSVSFVRCEFTNSGAAGIIADSSAVFVRQSVVRNSSGRGISFSRMYDAGAITNTIVSSCSTTGIVLEDFTSISLTNNVVASNGYHGIHLDNNSEPTILNTIVTSNGRYGMLAENSSTPFLDFNDVWDNGQRLPGEPSPNYHGAAASVLEPGPGSLEADPQFVFTTDGDYFLAPGSPCVNAGHPDAQYNDGTDGSRNDMGAYGGPEGANVGPVRTMIWAQR